MSRYLLFGNPVSHSLSSQLYALFAKQFDMTIDYQTQCVPLDQFKNAADDFRAQGGIGANITIPFKTSAFEYADELTDRAKLTGAVNLFIFKSGKCIGDNTDGIGLMNDLKNHSIDLHHKNILVLGAGGAARGILGEIIREKPRKIAIYNRTVENAEHLIEFFKPHFQMTILSDEKNVDIIINATSSDFENYFNLNLSNAFCYDLNYGERHRAFSNWVKRNSASLIVDGLGMLAEQAAENFFQWFGKRPETGNVIQRLRVP